MDGAIRPISAFVTPLDDSASGNALLEVRYEAGLTPADTVIIQSDKRPIVLRDDGRNGDRRAADGIFSAITSTDLHQFLTEQQRVIRLTRGRVPRYEGRVRVGSVDLRRQRSFDLRQIRRGMRMPILSLGVPDPLLEPRSLMITDLAVVQDPVRTINPCNGAG